MTRTKWCARCHRSKPLRWFTKDASCPDGHKAECKTCADAWQHKPPSRDAEMARRKAMIKAESQEYYRRNYVRPPKYLRGVLPRLPSRELHISVGVEPGGPESQTIVGF